MEKIKILGKNIVCGKTEILEKKLHGKKKLKRCNGKKNTNSGRNIEVVEKILSEKNI